MLITELAPLRKKSIMATMSRSTLLAILEEFLPILRLYPAYSADCDYLNTRRQPHLTACLRHRNATAFGASGRAFTCAIELSIPLENDGLPDIQLQLFDVTYKTPRICAEPRYLRPSLDRLYLNASILAAPDPYMDPTRAQALTLGVA